MAHDKIHIWIGLSEKTDEEFSKYFNQSAFLADNNRFNNDPSYVGDGPNLELVCQFCRDVNKLAYDDDWITVYRTEETDLRALIEEVPVWEDDVKDKIYNECISKGIEKANAFFSYSDDELVIETPLPNYNGLIYLGIFENPT